MGETTYIDPEKEGVAEHIEGVQTESHGSNEITLTPEQQKKVMYVLQDENQ